MKILLIQPRIHGKPSAPPLGLAYLASVSRADGHEVMIIDNDVEQYEDVELVERARRFGPDVVGITSVILSRYKSVRLAAELDNIASYIVFGGPQATLSPEFYIKKPNQFVIRGEGEVAFIKFIAAIQAGTSLTEVPSLTFMGESGKIVANQPASYIEDLDTIPYPAFDLLPMEKYTHKFEGARCATMISSRGCPYKCVYCYHTLNTKFRYRSTENVIREIQFLQSRYGYRSFKFFDDVFSLKKSHTLGLCKAFVENGLDIKWQVLTRVNLVDENLLHAMYEAGCRQISFGIESGCQKTLDKISKGVTLSQNRWALNACREAGIATKAYIMIGFPWETKEDIRETIAFVEETTPDIIQVLFPTPMPNTDMDIMMRNEGMPIDQLAMESLEGMPDLIVPTFETEHWTKAELIGLYDELHERYFAAGGKAGKSFFKGRRLRGEHSSLSRRRGGRLEELLSPLEAIIGTRRFGHIVSSIRGNSFCASLVRRFRQRATGSRA